MNLLDTISVKRKKPINLKHKDVVIFEHEFEKSINAVSIDDLEKASITTSGFLFSGISIYKPFFTTGMSRRSLLKAYLELVKKYFTKVDFLKNVYFVTTSTSANFFHWHLDVLPKLEVLSGFKKSKVVLPSRYASSFYKNTLEFYPGIDFEFLDGGGSCFQLKFFPDTAPTGNYRPEIVKALAKRLKIKPSPTSDTELKIYISRKKAKLRKILNEDEFVKDLVVLGFTILYMEDLTYEEQVSYTSRASTLVSLHGAGLTHMLFMPQSSRVIEIRAEDDTHNNCYYSLASDLNHDYFYVFAKSVDKSKTTGEANFLFHENFVDEIKGIIEYE